MKSFLQDDTDGLSGVGDTGEGASEDTSDSGTTDTPPDTSEPVDTSAPTDTADPVDTGEPVDTAEPLPETCETNNVQVTDRSGTVHVFEGAVFLDGGADTWLHMFQTRGEFDPCDWGRNLESQRGAMFTMEIVPAHPAGTSLQPRGRARNAGEFEIKWVDSGAGESALGTDGTATGSVVAYTENDSITVSGVSMTLDDGAVLSNQSFVACYCAGMDTGA